MATYKVIQDIEAEDKLFGPLTFKQAVFGLSGVFFAWLNFLVIAKGFAAGAIIFTPPMLLGFFLAVPWSKDQSTEVWVLAKLRFKFKSKVRIWDQSGMEELVTITVPKLEQKVFTDNLSQLEVRSRLEALAETIDSRGWAVKHAQVDPSFQLSGGVSDRLVSPAVLPQEVPVIDLASVPDIMEAGTPTYANLDRMMQQRAGSRMQQNLDKLDRVRSGESVDEINRPQVQFTPPAPASSQDAPVDEAALSAQLKSRHRPDVKNTHQRTINPINPYAVEPSVTSDQDSGTHEQKTENGLRNTSSQAQAPIADPATPAILDYVNNNDLDVATIARQAKKDTDGDNGEVVVSLR